MGRPLRGSRLVSFYVSGSDADPIATPSLSTLDSAFQLQEYIGAVVRLDPHDIDRIVKVPGRNANPNGDEREKEGEGEDERVSIDEACWIYEQLRRLAQDLTHPLITMLQQECTRQTCPEMKAGEWLYLCVAHGNSGAMEHCCAIDYIVHTLDSATALLNSPRAFPSRISIPPTSHRHFPSLARRLGRIFAHAYYHHRLAFESAEAESALYARFLALSRQFDLVPAEFLVIPERNEQSEEGARSGDDTDRKNVTLLTRDLGGPIASPPSALPATSPSPRMGGRSRTDTMYHSGRYVGLHGQGSPVSTPGSSPQLIPGLLTTSASDGKHDQETPMAPTNDVTEGAVTHVKEMDGILEQGERNRVGDEALEKEDTALPRAPGQVIARDFALEAPHSPVAVRELPVFEAETTIAPTEDASGRIETAEAEAELGDASSCLEILQEAFDLASSTSTNVPTVPADSVGPASVPSYSEIPVIKNLLPIKVSQVTEVHVEPELSPEKESVVELAPHAEVLSEASDKDDGRDTGAEDDEKREDEVKEDAIVAEIETPFQVADGQQGTEEGNEDEDTTKTLEREDT